MLSANITRSSGLLPCTSRVFQGNLFQTSLLFSPNRKRGTNRVLSVMEASAAPEAQHISANNDDVLLQYIILRRDLWAELGWPLGSVVAQGCHAATAALWLSRESPNTQQYCGLENLDHMHKVVLEVKGETQLRNLSQKLGEAGILHKLWVEQPEDFPTCIATAPYPKTQVQPIVKKLKLCKGT